MNIDRAPVEVMILDIEGRKKSHAEVVWKVFWAMPLGSLGILLMLPAISMWMENDLESAIAFVLMGFVFLIIAAILPAYKHAYLNVAERQIVIEKHYAWFCASKQSRHLTDFSHVVVRHLCIPGGEGPDTYTGSVGLKPVDGKSVFWVKSFPATEDEFPQATQEFARKLKEMTGLPSAPRTDD